MWNGYAWFKRTILTASKVLSTHTHTHTHIDTLRHLNEPADGGLDSASGWENNIGVPTMSSTANIFMCQIFCKVFSAHDTIPEKLVALMKYMETTFLLLRACSSSCSELSANLLCSVDVNVLRNFALFGKKLFVVGNGKTRLHGLGLLCCSMLSAHAHTLCRYFVCINHALL